MRRYEATFLEAIRFGLIGLCATVTYLLVSLISHHAGLQAYFASLIGYLASVGISYFGHSSFTFRSDRPHRSKGPRFLVVTFFVFALTNVIIFFVTGPLGQPFAIATLVVAISIPVLTWLLSRFWVFGTGVRSN